MTEQEREDLQQQAEQGRKAEIALEFLGEFLLRERTHTIYNIEHNLVITAETPITELHHISYLQALRKFEDMANSFIVQGKIAEEELNSDE